MCPSYVVHVGGGEGSSAVEAESHAVELASHIGDIFFGGDAWVLAGLDGVLFCWETECVEGDSVEDVFAFHAVVAGHHVGGDVSEWVSDVESFS